MAINFKASRSLLRQFIAQELTGCPAYFCPTVSSIGLCYSKPVLKSGTEGENTPTYYTYELRDDKLTALPPPAYNYDTKTPGWSRGYSRDIIGENNGSQMIAHLTKMNEPNGEVNEAQYTNNKDIIILGENTNENSQYWFINYFGLFNTDGNIDSINEGVSSDSGYSGVRWSKGLVLFGELKTQEETPQTIEVAVGYVPLFRKGNFRLTFSSN